jgi:propanol-preferring alcohol dehydrogenase
MKAAVLHEFGQPLVIEQVPDPLPGPSEVVVRVAACGIDGTDLKLLRGFGYTPELPFIMGHEPAGTIESVGADVRGWRPGERVIPYIFCIPLDSPWYGTPREQLSPELAGVIGVKGQQGGYAERLPIAANQLLRIPKQVGWHDAAVLCDAGLTAWHAIKRAGVTLGETALAMGVGGVGGFVVQFARMAGARVIAVDRTPAKLERARQLGADETLEAAPDGVAQEVRRLTRGRGVDCVFDVVGSAESTTQALDALHVGGRVVIVGYTPDQLQLPAKLLAQNEFQLIGCRAGSRHELAEVIDMAAQGRIRSVVTDVRPLAEVNQALQDLDQGRVLGRLVLEIG